MNKFAITLGAIVLAAGSQANLLSNADFENVNYTSSDSYQVVNAGGTDISSWTVGATSVDIVKAGYPTIDTYAIDLVGTPGPGSISQEVALGGANDFTFSIYAAYTGGDLNKVINVTFGGQTQSIMVADSTLSLYTLNFSGVTGTTSTLTLASDNSNTGNGNTFVDNASLVAAVPEPATMVGLALGAVALIKRRRK